ncbi:dienelactone hydrolase family protein [Amorphus orientalis]|uniref:Carboxymethylenebutenolidase n=1 Tax=Amorphus orientalis TaxID=649198 RepID=A0AAE3VN43_9HYPH|nr:dienelactone hydrolase family protein [Amorphus orientalis]MDQ0315076.1 carboxymethylenebutenolidase [Amorphus orientalis]
MGETITLTAGDGFQLGAYVATPTEEPQKGGVVVVQEIFGVNRHIREVCDWFAHAGYKAIAPAIFDRTEPGFESGYSEEEIKKARSFIANPDFDQMLMDVGAAKAVLAEEGPVAVVGYCLGGSLAFAAATRMHGLAAAVGYYGGKVKAFADEKPMCPVMLHFGETDQSIPMEDVEEVRRKRPEVELYVYPAGHGFNCDHRSAYEPESARIAGERTLAFLDKHVGAYQV